MPQVRVYPLCYAPAAFAPNVPTPQPGEVSVKARGTAVGEIVFGGRRRVRHSLDRPRLHRGRRPERRDLAQKRRWLPVPDKALLHLALGAAVFGNFVSFAVSAPMIAFCLMGP